MLQKTIMCVFYFLHYYHNNAFSPSFFHMKNNDLYHLSMSNKNDFERNDIKMNYLEKNDSNIDIKKPFNKNSRLGRSKDEDGKSNIWSVEPKMEVINEELTETNKNILTFGLIITGFLTSLPLLYTLNQYVQNIDY